MRSDLIFGALTHVNNRYQLCQLAAKATRKLHKPNTRLQDTTNEVLDRFKDTVPMDDAVEPPVEKIGAGLLTERRARLKAKLCRQQPVRADFHRRPFQFSASRCTLSVATPPAQSSRPPPGSRTTPAAFLQFRRTIRSHSLPTVQEQDKRNP